MAQTTPRGGRKKKHHQGSSSHRPCYFPLFISLLLPGRLDAEPLTSSTLRTALTDWCNDPTAAEATHGHISDWDTSGVKDMSELIFAHCSTSSTFNEDISRWNTARVKNMRYMFNGAHAFNQGCGDLGISNRYRLYVDLIE